MADFDYILRETVVTREHRPGFWENGIYSPDAHITAIGCGAFMAESLKGIRLSSCLRSIDREAFAYCMQLEEIVIPETITHIPESAFYCCENLKKVVFESTPTAIGRFAFAGCFRLTEFVVAGVSKTPEEMIALQIAQPYAFFGCGCDIREPLPDASEGDPQLSQAIPRYESYYYRQQLLLLYDLQEGMHFVKQPTWNRQDPAQFQWMPGISREDLRQFLEKHRLGLPEEYENVLLKTNGAGLFRQMMILYSVPTENENDWQWEHSLPWLNSPQTRNDLGIPQALYLLGRVGSGIWFGVVQQDGQPKMAEFSIRDKQLRVYREYAQWRQRLHQNYQFDPHLWEQEDRMKALEGELDAMGYPDLCDTSLWEIRDRAQAMKSGQAPTGK